MGKMEIASIPAKFFQEWPLYRKFEADLTIRADSLDDEELYESINLECPKCRNRQTFVLGFRETDGWWINRRQEAFTEEHGEVDLGHPGLGPLEPPPPAAGGDIVTVQFHCARCKEGRYKFMYRVADDGKSIIKVGQYPPWSIEIPKAVQRLLGVHAEDYRKGMANEAIGYGVGAFAYYRRVVENVIDDLLGQIESLIAESGEREAYHAQLANISGSQSAQKRIDVVKDLLPASLRQGGLNPLDVLHDALSVGLHEGTDEDCLNMAMMIRESLVYLIREIDAHGRAGQAFRENMAQIKRRVEKRGKRKTDVQ